MKEYHDFSSKKDSNPMLTDSVLNNSSPGDGGNLVSCNGGELVVLTLQRGVYSQSRGFKHRFSVN